MGPYGRCATSLQVLGLLVGLTLRNPENAERAVEEGCVDVVIEVNPNPDSNPKLNPNPLLPYFHLVSTITLTLAGASHTHTPGSGDKSFPSSPDGLGPKHCMSQSSQAGSLRISPVHLFTSQIRSM